MSPTKKLSTFSVLEVDLSFRYKKTTCDPILPKSTKRARNAHFSRGGGVQKNPMASATGKVEGEAVANC